MAPSGQRGRPVIRRWNSTFYKEDVKRWLRGCLVLSNHSLSFEESPSKKIHVTLDLEAITDVNLERAWLGYKSLVVNAGSRKFWFSSFVNSQCVRKVLLHFIKESLFGRWEVGQCAPTLGVGGGSSALGRELLSVAHDSERTLSGAASQLISQGEQLDNAFMTMDQIQRDLGVGRQNIAYLESWLGHWHVPLADIAPHPSPNTASTETNDRQEYPIIYKSTKLEEESGMLVVSPDGLCVCNGERTIIQFSYREISVINVCTPWTMTITRRMMGKPDIVCQVTSARLISILKVLGSKVKEKIEYDEPEGVDFISHEASGETVSKEKAALGYGREKVDPTQERFQYGSELQQSQSMCSYEIVTESEAAELSNVLRDVKTLALGISSELDVQNEKITHLTDNVTNVTEEVSDNNKRMKRLL